METREFCGTTSASNRVFPQPARDGKATLRLPCLQEIPSGSLPTTDIALLLRKKILQLDDRTRMKFKIKLGFTLMRANEDELQAGLENPWQEEQRPG